MAQSSIVSHIQPDIGRKSQNIYTPPAFSVGNYIFNVIGQVTAKKIKKICEDV